MKRQIKRFTRIGFMCAMFTLALLFAELLVFGDYIHELWVTDRETLWKYVQRAFMVDLIIAAWVAVS